MVVFDLTDLYSLSSCPKWLEDALKANVVRPLVFLVGTKRDLLVMFRQKWAAKLEFVWLTSISNSLKPMQSDAAYKNVEQHATRMSQALQAEYWSVSSKSGLNVDNFFRRVAALTFDLSVANEFDETGLTSKQIGQGLSKCTIFQTRRQSKCPFIHLFPFNSPEKEREQSTWQTSQKIGLLQLKIRFLFTVKYVLWNK